MPPRFMLTPSTTPPEVVVVVVVLCVTVPAVVLGGVGTLVITGVWIKLFPTLANRDRMHVPVEEAVKPTA